MEKKRQFYVMYKDVTADRETTYESGGVLDSFDTADEAYRYLDECLARNVKGRKYEVCRL